MPPAKPSRREYGTGSITWLSPRRARLRIRVPGETGQRTKVVRVAPKDKGGIGEAKAELERFVAELAVGTPTERTTVTVSEMLPRIVPVEDEDISKELERNFRKQKIRVETGARVNMVDMEQVPGIHKWEKQG